MMPELDRYAGTVLGAYGVTMVLIAFLVGASLWRASRVSRALARMEERMRGTTADGKTKD